MMLDISQEPLVLKMLPLSVITKRLSVRRLHTAGVLRLKESMQRAGFLDNFPLILMPLADETFLLIDGNHRFEAALALELPCVPCVLKTNLTDQECYTLALRSNSATETVVPSTLVTYAEFVWNRLDEHYKQQDIADMLGWSRDKVAKYAALKDISEAAWKLIVTTSEKVVTFAEATTVTS